MIHEYVTFEGYQTELATTQKPENNYTDDLDKSQ
jgi:hypothetical protein